MGLYYLTRYWIYADVSIAKPNMNYRPKLLLNQILRDSLEN